MSRDLPDRKEMWGEGREGREKLAPGKEGFCEIRTLSSKVGKASPARLLRIKVRSFVFHSKSLWWRGMVIRK